MDKPSWEITVFEKYYHFNLERQFVSKERICFLCEHIHKNFLAVWMQILSSFEKVKLRPFLSLTVVMPLKTEDEVYPCTSIGIRG